MLQKIYDNWMPPTPAFKPYHEGVPEGMVPYISSSDVHDYKYNIRIVPEEVFLSEDDDRFEKMEEGTVIAHYESMEELVADGWILDWASILNIVKRLNYCGEMTIFAET